MAAVLENLGSEVKIKSGKIEVDNRRYRNFEAPYSLVKTMRASVLVMGPLLGARGRVRVSLPGGCTIGARPINLHLKGLEKLGARIKMSGGYIELKAKKLTGTYVYLDYPSVGATENIMIAAVLARGKTRLENAAREPEIVDLANFLNQMGAKIKGAGTSTLEIEGVKELKGTTYRVIPDRIEAGTFMVAAAITKGEVTIKKIIPAHLTSVANKLTEVGVKVEKKSRSSLKITTPQELKNVEVETAPYPGFPTDMQAQLMALMSLVKGKSYFVERVFENRFMHVSELNRMGAQITVKGNMALVEGVPQLHGAEVMATDLRASAALVLAGLAAQGETTISRIYHLDRGYEKIEKKLKKLQAKIERIKE
jgi:UDP-N-acetylglucosamine 1-carboxyvinyltransferase